MDRTNFAHSTSFLRLGAMATSTRTTESANPGVTPATGLESSAAADGDAEGNEDLGAAFSLRDTRQILNGLFEHKPWIYWTDFILTTSLAYACALVYLWAPWTAVGVAMKVVTFFIAGFAMFRTATMIHEIVHMRKGLMPGFRAAWNIFFGIPLMMPSLLYSNHFDHHRRHHYGTEHDGEYHPFARRSPWKFVTYFGQALVLPIFAVFRALVLAPLSWFHPPLRHWVLARFSSYGSNFSYRRELSKNEPYILWTLVEIGCFLSLMGLAVRIHDGMPLVRLVQIYLLSVFTIGLNWVRNLAGHRFRNEGGTLSALGQLEDSVTIDGNPITTELLFPIGLRYHALHHLYPSLPYHSLGTAHRRLLAQLPADSLYHRTIFPSFTACMRQLWSESCAAARASRDSQLPNQSALSGS